MNYNSNLINVTVFKKIIIMDICHMLINTIYHYCSVVICTVLGGVNHFFI